MNYELTKNEKEFSLLYRHREDNRRNLSNDKKILALTSAIAPAMWTSSFWLISRGDEIKFILPGIFACASAIILTATAISMLVALKTTSSRIARNTSTLESLLTDIEEDTINELFSTLESSQEASSPARSNS